MWRILPLYLIAIWLLAFWSSKRLLWCWNGTRNWILSACAFDYQLQMILWGYRPRRENGGGKKKGMVRFFFFIYYHLMRSCVVTMWHTWPRKLAQLKGSVKYYEWCLFAFSLLFYMFFFYWLLMFCLHNPLGYVVSFFICLYHLSVKVETWVYYFTFFHILF